MPYNEIDFYHSGRMFFKEKKRYVVRKDNAGDFAIRIKRDDGFTVLEWSFMVELARSV